MDVVAVEGGLEQELLDKLPEVDVGAWPWRALLGLSLLVLLVWRVDMSKTVCLLKVSVGPSDCLVIVSVLFAQASTFWPNCVYWWCISSTLEENEQTWTNPSSVGHSDDAISSSSWPDKFFFCKSIFASGFVPTFYFLLILWMHRGEVYTKAISIFLNSDVSFEQVSGLGEVIRSGHWAGACSDFGISFPAGQRFYPTFSACGG